MPHYGIDTSIFVRLLTGTPEKEFEQTKAALMKLLSEDASAEIEVSNIVIGEAYFVLQHHYGIPKDQARLALISVLTSGLVRPQRGPAVLEALAHPQEPGVMDRLIVGDYAAEGRITITLDRKMARLGSTLIL